MFILTRYSRSRRRETKFKRNIFFVENAGNARERERKRGSDEGKDKIKEKIEYRPWKGEICLLFSFSQEAR